MADGIVKWFNYQKGYGFILGDDDKEYFVHFSGLAQGTFIRDNDVVSFEAAETDKGVQAKNVTLVKKASEIEAEGGEAEEGREAEEAPAEEQAEEPAAEAEEPKEEEPAAEAEEPKEEEPAEEEKKEE